MRSAADEQRAAPTQAYDGVTVDELARRLDVPSVVAFDLTESTLDVAHALAADGAPAGTVVIADAQSAGRGRQGRAWQSEPGAGIWLTLVERPSDAIALGVLSLRIGLALAPNLEPFAASPVALKWPNDLYVGAAKLAGVLVEARWKSGVPDWIAIGVGVNVRQPSHDIGGGVLAAALAPGTSRVDVLEACVRAVRLAGAQRGVLSDDERSAFARRDFAAGRRCIEPLEGRVHGIASDGALLVDAIDGRHAVRAGSLVLHPDQQRGAS